AKEYVKKTYGKYPHHSYFTGSSTGGRHALQVAQKYPQDYNAVFSGCPAWHNDIYVPARAWGQVAMKEAGHYLSPSKVKYAKDAVIAFEDPKDGLEDGIVNNPFDITFDIFSLVGTKTPEGEIFTAEDAQTIKDIWAGCPYEGGILWYGFTPTASYHRVAKCEGEPLKGVMEPTTLGKFRYGITFNPEFDVDDLTREVYVDGVLKFYNTVSQEMSATPDLSGLRKRGGKLLIMHGLDDDMVPPGCSMRYYEDVCKAEGGYEKAAEFTRYFLVPGVNHSFKGPGANLRKDEVAILIDWVENGVAPDSLVFTKKDFGSRPFYPYPYTTEYVGGDINSPSSFRKSLSAKDSYLKEVGKVKWY
ncbi:MAG: tannase/feruloyl esterase family alpha/beta hydrolase, partial [Bacteroidales bacterium]|nr:tannase/feruloyl esterase family alpha/beta hydrolase [Bacteroidales bacterium]